MLEKVANSFDIKYCRLDGNTAMSERMKIVNDFNSKISHTQILFLSNKAGGVGLNLVGASTMILFDPDWNPANDLQAIGRIWRPGQLGNTRVYRFVVKVKNLYFLEF